MTNPPSRRSSRPISATAPTRRRRPDNAEQNRAHRSRRRRRRDRPDNSDRHPPTAREIGSAQTHPRGRLLGPARPEDRLWSALAGICPRSRSLHRPVLISIKKITRRSPSTGASSTATPTTRDSTSAPAEFLDQNKVTAELEETYKRAIQRFSDRTWHHKLARWYLREKRQSDYERLTREVTDVFSGTARTVFRRGGPRRAVPIAAPERVR